FASAFPEALPHGQTEAAPSAGADDMGGSWAAAAGGDPGSAGASDWATDAAAARAVKAAMEALAAMDAARDGGFSPAEGPR
ncbi:MAG: hypothetical protein LBQ12_15995, partial [Deltaproteobacteria bacterium]|nr:hypothetical protein [Deltaproteobacteria bacterium]